VHAEVCIPVGASHEKQFPPMGTNPCKYLSSKTHAMVCMHWAESSKTFNNSWIQLHKILKFGSFVVLLDPLKIFQNLFVQMVHTTFTANQRFPHTFPMVKP